MQHTKSFFVCKSRYCILFIFCSLLAIFFSFETDGTIIEILKLGACTFILYIHHRRRIYTEEKAKVVTAAWGTELLQFLATLELFCTRMISRIGWNPPILLIVLVQIILSFLSSLRKIASAARYGRNSQFCLLSSSDDDLCLLFCINTYSTVWWTYTVWANWSKILYFVSIVTVCFHHLLSSFWWWSFVIGYKIKVGLLFHVYAIFLFTDLQFKTKKSKILSLFTYHYIVSAYGKIMYYLCIIFYLKINVPYMSNIFYNILYILTVNQS